MKSLDGRKRIEMVNEKWNIAQMAMISAINTETQSMITANQIRIMADEAVKYSEEAFYDKARELIEIYNNCMKEDEL